MREKWGGSSFKSSAVRHPTRTDKGHLGPSVEGNFHTVIRIKSIFALLQK